MTHIIGQREQGVPKTISRQWVTDGKSSLPVLVTLESDTDGLFSREKEKNAAADVAMAKRIGELLNMHYCGHPWFVSVDSHQGIAYICIPVLMREWRYVIPLPKLTDKMVIEAGGHILERYRMPRSTIDFAAFHKAHDLRIRNSRMRVPE